MEHPGLEVEGIFTHFAKSDEADKTSANHQLELFQNFIDRIQSELGLADSGKALFQQCGDSGNAPGQHGYGTGGNHDLRFISFRRSK